MRSKRTGRLPGRSGATLDVDRSRPGVLDRRQNLCSVAKALVVLEAQHGHHVLAREPTELGELLPACRGLHRSREAIHLRTTNPIVRSNENRKKSIGTQHGPRRCSRPEKRPRPAPTGTTRTGSAVPVAHPPRSSSAGSGFESLAAHSTWTGLLLLEGGASVVSGAVWDRNARTGLVRPGRTHREHAGRSRRLLRRRAGPSPAAPRCTCRR